MWVTGMKLRVLDAASGNERKRRRVVGRGVSGALCFLIVHGENSGKAPTGLSGW